MPTNTPIESVLYFLLAAVIAVPLFRRIGLGAILGYLIAGIIIGPQGFSLISDPQNVLHISEIGIILLLFLIGLELNPSKLWEMRNHIALLGGGQLIITSVLVVVVLVFLLRQNASTAIVIGLALALSSTAFAIQLMAEKGVLGCQEGRRGFSILLMQDLAVIPILVVVQLLADTSQGAGAVTGDWWPGPLAIVSLLLMGRYLLNPALKVVALYGGRESMTATSLLIVVGAAYLMELAHLSMGLGAFVAGIMLANSSFRHQLETDIEPFKGLTLGLFFIAIGMTLDLNLLLNKPFLILTLAVALMFFKALVIGCLLKLSNIKWQHGLGVAVMLSQGGEFGFVIVAQALGQNILSAELAGMVTLVIGLSMALTAPMLLLVETLLSLKRETIRAPEFEKVTDEPEVLVLGFGRFGQVTGRILAANGIPFTALDKDAEHIEFVNRYGNRVHFGDAGRTDLLEKAGADSARALIVGVDSPEDAEKIVTRVRGKYPDVTIIARARNRVTYLKLKAAGASVVIRELFSSSLDAATETLIALGYSTSEALRSAELFKEHDERLLKRALEHHDNFEKVVEIGEQGRKELESLFKQDKG